DHDAVAPRTFAGHEPACHVQRHLFRFARQRVAPAAAAPGIELEVVPGTHDDAVALGGQDLARAVRADERLAAALPGQPAVDAPGLGEPAIVVDGDLAVLEEAVADAQGVAAAVFAGPAGIGDGLVHLDAKREVALEELVGHV